MRTFLDSERRARVSPGAARPGAWRLRGWRRRWQFGSQGLGSPRAQAALSSERTSSSTAPFLPGSRMRDDGHGRPRPRSSAGGRRVWSCCRLVGLPGDSPSFVPPARCQAPRFLVAGGGRGGRERALPCYFLPQVFLFHSRAQALALSNKSVPHLSHLGPCAVVSVGSVWSPLPRQMPTSELNACSSCSWCRSWRGLKPKAKANTFGHATRSGSSPTSAHRRYLQEEYFVGF